VSYVEERWSPALSVKFGQKCRCNHTPEVSGAITERHRRAFLSQAGPQVELEFFKLSITFWLIGNDLPSETKKATHWIALTCRGVFASSSERTPRKGLLRWHAGAPDQSYSSTAGLTPMAPIAGGSWVCCEVLTWQ
jgi:hypothetical protein